MCETNKIPYLASIVLPDGVDESMLDDFRDPSSGDVEKYGQLANIIANMLEAQSNQTNAQTSSVSSIYNPGSENKLV